jgi:hypothetical protein
MKQPNVWREIERDGYNNELNKFKRMIFVFEHEKHGMNGNEN